MNNTFRFNSVKEAIDCLMCSRNLTNQQAMHFIWDNQFTVGTDKALWLTIPDDLGF